MVKAGEPLVGFETMNNGFGGDYLLHLAVDHTNANRVFAATNTEKLFGSADQGRTWTALGQPHS